MTKESYFEELSYALRRRGLLTRSVEEGTACFQWSGRAVAGSGRVVLSSMTLPGWSPTGQRRLWPKS